MQGEALEFIVIYCGYNPMVVILITLH